MNPFEMVLGIIIVVTIGKVLQARYGIVGDRPGSGRRQRGDAGVEAENQQLRDELRAMKERLAVLERLATDDDTSGARLDREIEKLRDRG